MAQALLQNSLVVMQSRDYGQAKLETRGGGAGAVGVSGGVPVLFPRLNVSERRRRCGAAAVTVKIGGGVELQSRFRSRGAAGAGGVRCSLNDAPSTSGPTVYQGIYGPWSVEKTDVREVILYRAGLVTSAAAFLVAASSAFLPDDFALKSFIEGVYDPLYAVGAGGLGLSLVLIHIYVTPIKRALQLLWATGVLGSIALAANFAAPADAGLVSFVVENPAGVWAVGPLFAALTGLAFKEGLCYGKFEAIALVFVIPALLLGHLSGVMDGNAKLGLLGVWIALFSVFASRKFTQPIKDDIGDKSVFLFQALPEEEQQTIALRLQEQTTKDREQN